MLEPCSDYDDCCRPEPCAITKTSRMVNSTIPCYRPEGCIWPACSQGCDGRPGRERITKDEVVEAVRDVVAQASADDWVRANEFVQDAPVDTQAILDAINEDKRK